MTEVAQGQSAEYWAECAELNRAAMERAQVERDQAKRALEAFQERVREVAIEYGETHDMCSVLDDALEELGLPRRDGGTHEVTLTLEVTVSDVVLSRNIRAQHGSGWWESTLGIGGWQARSADSDTESVGYTSIRVTGCEVDGESTDSGY